MGEYLFAILTVSVSCAVVSYLSYPSALTDAAKRGLSIILILAIVSPLPALIEGIADFSLSDFESVNSGFEAGQQGYEKAMEDAFSLGIGRLVAEKFSLNEDDISVRVKNFNAESMEAERIYITLSGLAALSDAKRIEDYVFREGLGDCEVNVLIG